MRASRLIPVMQTIEIIIIGKMLIGFESFIIVMQLVAATGFEPVTTRV